MAWIRREDLNGQVVLDEVSDEERIIYVQVEDPQGAIDFAEEENVKKGADLK